MRSSTSSGRAPDRPWRNKDCGWSRTSAFPESLVWKTRSHLEQSFRYIGGGGYFHSVEAVAARLRVRPAYLSQSALRRGYQYSRALRWIRFLHGMALREGGAGALEAVWRIGFSDPSGWTRFVRALVGKDPRELPRVPLEFWGWRAVEDVYLRRLVVRSCVVGEECGGNDKQRR